MELPLRRLIALLDSRYLDAIRPELLGHVPHQRTILLDLEVDERPAARELSQDLPLPLRERPML